MKKFIVSLLFLLSMANLSNSQWISHFSSITESDVNLENAKGNAITSDLLGNSYVTGFSYENSNGNDIITIKYNTLGMVVWAAGYNGTSSGDDEGSDICTDACGNVYVVGTSFNGERNNDLTLVKYNAFGSEVWARTYGVNSGNFQDRGLGIAVDSDGNIFVTGYTTNADGYTDIVTQKYDTQGNPIWTKLNDGESHLNGQGLSIAVGSSGNVYVAGFTTSAAGGNDIAVIKYNSAGTQVWATTINGGGNSEDKAWGVVVDNQDNAYITGYTTEVSQGTNAYTAKISSAGNIVWSKSYNGSGNQSDKAWGIVTELDGSVFITGETYSSTGVVNYLTIKYNTYGSEVWAKTYNGTGSGTDVASSICIVNGLLSKTVVVTGKSWGSTDTYDYATVKYDAATGSQQQVNRYSMSGVTNDVAKGVTVALTKIVVTGFSQLITDGSSENSVISTQSLAWGEESQFTSENTLPSKFSLNQNFPNPFNPSTTISFDLPSSSYVKLTVYDMLGKQVSVLINQQLDAGTHSISYSNLLLASGIYFYELSAGEYRDIKKMNLIK